MVGAIFDVIGEIISAFASLLVSLFGSVVSIFYTAGSGNDPGSLTVVGTLALVGLGTGLVIWGFHYLRSLIRVRTK